MPRPKASKPPAPAPAAIQAPAPVPPPESAAPGRGRAYDLTDAEKRDLIKLINEGKPLPEKYRFILFADKREVELVWNGKTREVCTAILPFQSLEHIDEPRREKSVDEELALDTGGRPVKGWTNKLIWGDNKLILSSLKSGALRRQIEDAGGLKLIYIDPPFDVGADFSMDIEIGGETFHKEPNLLEQIAYRDTWGRGADSFIAMIYERLILMRDLMHKDASIYVHCDWRLVGALRTVMEEVFQNIENVISWKRSAIAASVKTQWRNSQDFILFFSKNGTHKFNPQYGEYSESSKKHYSRTDEKGTYRVVPLMASGKSSGNTGELWRGVDPNRRGKNGMHWLKQTDVLEKLDAQGLVVWNSEGIPELKYYLEEAKGVYVSDFWDDIDVINSMATEYQGYNTQKPEALLDRIIKASSNEGDLVADFFCGSGTTAAVAEKFGRKWIATDLGKFGIHTTRKRLIQVQRELKAAGKPFHAFEVLNLGRYERNAYLNISGRLTGKKKEQALTRKEREFRDLILKAYRAEALPEAGFFHGKNGGRLVVVGPINLPVGRLFVEEVITECRKRRATRVDVLAFEFEMGLFPAVLEEAKQKGIDIAPKTIPPEVFDKRAVEKGQVRFHDVAYIEVTPRFDKDEPLKLAVQLTDFSVYYSQGLTEAIAADLKEGKSEVMCEQGKLIKVSKDKSGVITREVLTRKWTDWVDYWAVDFNYESRKEVIKVAKNLGVDDALPGTADTSELLEFEERWTGAYIFENEWQSFRTRQNRDLDLTTAAHTYPKPGRYTIGVKVIDIFGNDTMTLVPVTVG
jgi:site-specific DNA-methyltransferase (adenine-specific)/adenine-specific DNA-methyltransferase